jgi:hypothetical protein
MALLRVLLKPHDAEKEVLTLTKKELAVLDKAQPDHILHIVETEFEGTVWWLMRVKLTTHDKEYEMVTTRGKTKLWKRLDIAADFIRETCPETKTIVVNFK